MNFLCIQYFCMYSVRVNENLEGGERYKVPGGG